MSAIEHSKCVQQIQTLSESAFALLVSTVIPFAVTSASSLLDVIQGVCATMLCLGHKLLVL